MAKKRKNLNKSNHSVVRNDKISSVAMMKQLEMPSTMRAYQYVITGLLFISIFLLYFFTLAPEIPTGDSGEFISSAYLLGISHPPGYPLYNLLGKLFSFIPYGNIAWRINLSSAVCNTAAGFFIYLTLYRITTNWLAALIGAAFFATSPISWEYSLKAEVFALNNFFAAWILYLLVTLRGHYLDHGLHLLDDTQYQNKSRSCFYLILFACGLALTNHHTIILLAPGVLLAFWYYGRQHLLNARTFFTGLMLFFIGLSLYLYVPIRAHAEPYLSWDDAKTWGNFIRLVSRADYGTFTLININEKTYDLIEKYHLYFSSLIKQFNPFGLTLALLGILSLLRMQEKKLKIILLVTFLLTSFFFFILANVPRSQPVFLGIFERFYLLPSVLVALFIGLGSHFLPRYIHTRLKTYQIPLWSYVTSAIAGLTVSIALYHNFPSVNQRDNFILYHFGRDLLSSVEHNAIIVARGDFSVNVLDYLQQIDKLRPDVIVLSREKLTYPFYLSAMKKHYPMITLPFAQFNVQDDSLLQFIKANIAIRPIYLTGSAPEENDPIYLKYQLMPMGLVQKIVDKDHWPNKENYSKQTIELWQHYHVPELASSYSKSSCDVDIVEFYALAHFYLGAQYQLLGLIDLAIREYNSVLHLHHEYAMLYKNLGLIYVNDKHQAALAIPYFKRYLAFHPIDKDNNKIQTFINQYEPKSALETALHATHQQMAQKILGTH